MFSNLALRICVLTSTILGSAKSMRSMASMQIRKNLLQGINFPAQWPFRPDDFRRQDEEVDTIFYSSPRLVTHIDDYAIKALTNYYEEKFFDRYTALDICSSWISHYPTFEKIQPSNVVGIGMNEYELSQNRQLTRYNTQDLNKNPMLPYETNSFDFVTCCVSVDYLTRPLEVFKEIHRVLKPEGLAIISQSNRCFPTKAIDIWLRTNDIEHTYIIASYFHYTGGFKNIEAFDISPNGKRSDPMFIIQATKAQ